MAPQDSFIDEEEDCCPLCVEDFDVNDKYFRPCPCGYQVCQFCYNNIKTTMNGLCPACRRPYDESTIEFIQPTPEQIKAFANNVRRNEKKKADQLNKETQKREVESLNRKHLSGLRVIQKNLVYVVGLNPNIREDEILQTLRGEKYFGQYGKILKIVVGRPKPGEAPQNGQGVYVTFQRKEDAARCIAAVNGSHNGDRILRAQLGTTKYCSAYLRNENCTNKACMFLHEPGENEDSYSRQDLSSFNSVSTQRPINEGASSSSAAARQAAKIQAPISTAQPVAAAAQPMTREPSIHESDSGDGSALPSNVSWANKGTNQPSRRGSQSTSASAPSPAVSQSIPAPTEMSEEDALSSQDQEADILDLADPDMSFSPELPLVETVLPPLDFLSKINPIVMSFSGLAASDSILDSFPPLFDVHGGERRRTMREQQRQQQREQQEEDRLQIEQESQADARSIHEPMEEEEPDQSGSLQLGGEPEDREGSQPPAFQRHPSSQINVRGGSGGPFGPSLGQNYTQNIASVNGRALTPQQQQQLKILTGQPLGGFMEQYPPGMGNPLSQGSGLFQQQGHNRQSSRYNFTSDGSSAPSNLKPSANPKLMAQQSSMMPSANLQQGSQFYASSMPGPPPGLKSSGTPPISMFGHGQFGNSMSGKSIFGGSQTDQQENLLREMIRGRGGGGGNQIHDTGKREYQFPSFHNQYPSSGSSTPAPASLLASLYSPQTGAFHHDQFGQKQKKKGKKHRHANTSSSGGGGLVDLADPSILQARMHHPQQSNAGVGQGLFGGQAQGGYNNNMMYGGGGFRGGW